MARARRQGYSVRELPSGRYQVRVRDGATGQRITVGTYRTKADADAAGQAAATNQRRGKWVAPERGRQRLDEYAADWIATNRRITSPRTRERYASLLRIHIAPQLGSANLGDITPGTVRRWHTRVTRDASPSTAAKAYRLLRAVFNTAVSDELVTRNPCRIDGGGVERPAERPTATVTEVQALAQAVPDRFRLVVLMAAYTGLRLGELAALTRADLDLERNTVTVSKNRQRLDDGSTVVLDPKSAAGRRTVAYPPPLQPIVEEHLSAYCASGPDALVFTGAKGAPLDRSRWGRVWRTARSKIGRNDLRFHDLRHTGNMLAAATGATTKQLMARMGHSSMRAALIYQHATADADAAIAQALGEVIAPTSDVEQPHD